MKCWICKRQARGFGHTDGRYKVADPRRYPLDWVFCSHRCMDMFHAIYGNWLRAAAESTTVRMADMIDPSDAEIAAMRTCLKAFGEVANAIGFGKPLGEYSEAEAMRVIDAIVTRYSDAMVEHHDATVYPLVRNLATTIADPFADLKDDLPWEQK